jgi:hypothetical protein
LILKTGITQAGGKTARKIPSALNGSVTDLSSGSSYELVKNVVFDVACPLGRERVIKK